MAFRMLDATQTAAALPFAELISALGRAVLEYAQGVVHAPERQVLPLSEGGLMLSMPAAAPDLAAHKLVNVCPVNRDGHLPTIQGLVTAFDGWSGSPLFTLDAPTVTARRTAGLTLLGIQVLHGSPREVLIIGTGKQAVGHLQGLRAVFPDARIWVLGSSFEKAQTFGKTWDAEATRSVPDAVDVVIAVTGSHTPVYDLPTRAGRLLVGVGAFTRDMAEYAPVTVLGSRVFVDDPAGARQEAGDLIQAGVDWSLVQPLASVLESPNRLAGNLAGDKPILLKTVGCAAWDLAACRVARQHLA